VEAKIDALWTDPIIKQIEFHKAIAFEARDLVRAARLAGSGLRAADAIHLATARRVGVAEFQTYDTRLFQYSARVGFPIREPVTEQPRLHGI
jgi:predicted nucleic acid-binding protein